MDWDDIRPPAKSEAVKIGENLDRLSISELEARISLLEAEITRVREEVDRKKAHEERAASVFKR